MIVFGSAVTKPEVYRDYAEPGIEVAREPDTLVLPRPAQGSIFANYNAIMDEAAEIEGLEALVLLHQDAEIQDPDFCAKLRTALADPEVAWWGAWARSACARSPGGRGRSPGPRSSIATPSWAEATSRH